MKYGRSIKVFYKRERRWLSIINIYNVYLNTYLGLFIEISIFLQFNEVEGWLIKVLNLVKAIGLI